MPVNSTTPASGSSTVAAAQILDRRMPIVKEAAFAAVGGNVVAIHSSGLRRLTELYVGNLPEIRFSLFLYPEYDRGDFVFQARNYISWRVVAINPGAIAPQYPFVTEILWVPQTTPQLLPVGQPIEYTLCCAGLQRVALEFDTSAEIPNVLQGEDRVVVTVSASQ